MRAGLEEFRRRGLAALLLAGVLLVAGATGAAAGGYGSDGSDCHDCPTPPPTTAPHSPPATTVPPHSPPSTPPDSPHYGSSYPVPPSNPPGNPPEPGEPQRDNPPLLPRTGSNTGTLVGIGTGVLAAGGALVIVARKRRLATVTA